MKIIINVMLLLKIQFCLQISLFCCCCCIQLAKEEANSKFSTADPPTNVNVINRETVLPQRLPVQKRGGMVIFSNYFTLYHLLIKYDITHYLHNRMKL